MNIFEKASRKKLRFTSDRGGLTTEQLWDLTLDSLDKIARSVNAELKEVSEESFVYTNASNPTRTRLELALDIIKHIIAAKLEAAEKAEKRAQNAARRKQLTEILEGKEVEELSKLSKDKLIKEIEALGKDV